MNEETKLETHAGNHIALSSSQSLWSDLKNAVRGTESDYTQITIGKAVLLLAVPMILELVMESTFAVVDIYFVSSLGA